MICPFCGRKSDSEDYCTRCYAPFDSEVRSIAYAEDADPRSNRIGPFRTKTATAILVVFMVILIVLFVFITEYGM